MMPSALVTIVHNSDKHNATYTWFGFYTIIKQFNDAKKPNHYLLSMYLDRKSRSLAE